MTESTESAVVDPEVDDLAARQASEYGTYVANGPIYVNGALAYAAGHPVPVSNVEQYKYLEQGLVREAGTDAPVVEDVAQGPQRGADIVIEPAGQPQVQPEAEMQPEPSVEPSADPSDDSAGVAEPTE